MLCVASRQAGPAGPEVAGLQAQEDKGSPSDGHHVAAPSQALTLLKVKTA